MRQCLPLWAPRTTSLDNSTPPWTFGQGWTHASGWRYESRTDPSGALRLDLCAVAGCALEACRHPQARDRRNACPGRINRFIFKTDRADFAVACVPLAGSAQIWVSAAPPVVACCELDMTTRRPGFGIPPDGGPIGFPHLTDLAPVRAVAR